MSTSTATKARASAHGNETSKTSFGERVAQKLIAAIEAGVAPWQRPWVPGAVTMPHNPVSGARYRGINRIMLLMSGRGDPRWMTYRQANSIGAQVRKGETGTGIEYWFAAKPEAGAEKSAGSEGSEGEGRTNAGGTTQAPRKRRLGVVHATVFNAEQIDGLPDEPLAEKTGVAGWDACDLVERVVKASGLIVRPHESRAFYRLSEDAIYMPPRSSFPERSGYYATLLHEMGHWTGHEARLNRNLSGNFGGREYAKEELRAEIASMIVGDHFGIGHDPSRHAAYAEAWVSVLKDDHREIFRATADAEKISAFIVAFATDAVDETQCAVDSDDEISGAANVL